jgi:hypothetical protein
MTAGSANEGILDYTRIGRSFRIAGGAVDRRKWTADANDAKTKTHQDINKLKFPSFYARDVYRKTN